MLFVYEALTKNICVIATNEIILSSGIGNYNDNQLWQQYTAFKAYANIGVTTASSILSYNINEDGTLGSYIMNSTIWNPENYQQYIKQTTNLKSYPCIYCDETIGMCSNLSTRLLNLYANSNVFIENTVMLAQKYNYDGYMVDLEPINTINSTILTDFILNWNTAMNKNNLTLILWIGGSTQYDERILNTTNLRLITMNTYSNLYSSYINVMSNLQISSNYIKQIGAGLLTNYGLKLLPNYNENYVSNNISEIIKWSKKSKINTISLWASHIDPLWFESLIYYIN